jgi:hypothetical protein
MTNECDECWAEGVMVTHLATDFGGSITLRRVCDECALKHLKWLQAEKARVARARARQVQ